MRLWHVDLIPYLPSTQLLAQWRELNSIFKKEPKHILINYIYNYPKEYLLHYSLKVKNEMVARGFKIKSWENYDKYFSDTINMEKPLRYPEHNFDYLQQCFYNLQEKYQRGQKGFDEGVYDLLSIYFYNNKSKYKIGKYEEGK